MTSLYILFIPCCFSEKDMNLSMRDGTSQVRSEADSGLATDIDGHRHASGQQGIEDGMDIIDPLHTDNLPDGSNTSTSSAPPDGSDFFMNTMNFAAIERLVLLNNLGYAQLPRTFWRMLRQLFVAGRVYAYFLA